MALPPVVFLGAFVHGGIRVTECDAGGYEVKKFNLENPRGGIYKSVSTITGARIGGSFFSEDRMLLLYKYALQYVQHQINTKGIVINRGIIYSINDTLSSVLKELDTPILQAGYHEFIRTKGKNPDTYSVNDKALLDFYSNIEHMYSIQTTDNESIGEVVDKLFSLPVKEIDTISESNSEVIDGTFLIIDRNGNSINLLDPALFPDLPVSIKLKNMGQGEVNVRRTTLEDAYSSIYKSKLREHAEVSAIRFELSNLTNYLFGKGVNNIILADFTCSDCLSSGLTARDVRAVRINFAKRGGKRKTKIKGKRKTKNLKKKNKTRKHK